MGIFVGYTDSFNQYLVYLPHKQTTVTATNPKFVENEKGECCSECCKPGKIMQQRGEIMEQNIDEFDDRAVSLYDTQQHTTT